MDNAEEELDLPFYMRKKRYKTGKSDSSTSEESFYRKQFKLGKFCLSVAESAKGIEYWSGLRMRDVNAEKLWSLTFNSAKVGLIFGEKVEKKNRFTATPVDFEMFVTQLSPTSSYIDYLVQAGNRVLEKYKMMNSSLQPHDLPRGVADVVVLGEMKVEDGILGRLVQKVDTFSAERNYSYLMNATGIPPDPKHMTTSALSITIKYVRCLESDGSIKDSSSAGLYFTMPFDEYVVLCKNPDYQGFCSRVEKEMPLHAYDNVRLESIRCKTLLKHEENSAKDIPDDIVVVVDGADLPSTQEMIN